MNFDPSLQVSYPLSLDRLNEFQEDTQLAAEVFAGLLPLGACILAGCATQGAGGVVLMALSDGNGGTRYEVMRVVANNNVQGNFLQLVEEEMRTQNGDGATVVYRIERRLEWRVNGSGTYVHWPSLPMAWMRKAPRDREAWTTCYGGTDWYAPSGDGYQVLRARPEGGRIHLQGRVKYAPRLISPTTGEDVRITDKDDFQGAVTSGVIDRYGEQSYYVLPAGLRPAGQVLVPVLYNGAVSWGIVSKTGELTLAAGSRTVGDEFSVDCYIDY